MNDIIIDTDNIVEKAAEVMRNLSTVLAEMGKAVAITVDQIAEMIRTTSEELNRIRTKRMIDWILNNYPNKKWVHMARHAKKFRVRKKYMNKIMNNLSFEENRIAAKMAINSMYGLEAMNND